MSRCGCPPTFSPSAIDIMPKRLLRDLIRCGWFRSLVVILAGSSGLGCNPPLSDMDSVRMESSAFGTNLGSVNLIDSLGTASTLAERLGGRAGLVMVLDETSCLSCGDYATELKIIEHKWPDLVQLVIVEGSINQEIADYFRTNRIAPLIDFESNVLRQLRQDEPPLIVLANGEGRVLLSDSRFGVASARFPISRVLGEIAAALHRDQR